MGGNSRQYNGMRQQHEAAERQARSSRQQRAGWQQRLASSSGVRKPTEGKSRSSPTFSNATPRS